MFHFCETHNICCPGQRNATYVATFSETNHCSNQCKFLAWGVPVKLIPHILTLSITVQSPGAKMNCRHQSTFLSYSSVVYIPCHCMHSAHQVQYKQQTPWHFNKNEPGVLEINHTSNNVCPRVYYMAINLCLLNTQTQACTVPHIWEQHQMGCKCLKSAFLTWLERLVNGEKVPHGAPNKTLMVIQRTHHFL